MTGPTTCAGARRLGEARRAQARRQRHGQEPEVRRECRARVPTSEEADGRRGRSVRSWHEDRLGLAADRIGQGPLGGTGRGGHEHDVVADARCPVAHTAPPVGRLPQRRTTAGGALAAPRRARARSMAWRPAASGVITMRSPVLVHSSTLSPRSEGGEAEPRGARDRPLDGVAAVCRRAQVDEQCQRPGPGLEEFAHHQFARACQRRPVQAGEPVARLIGPQPAELVARQPVGRSRRRRPVAPPVVEGAAVALPGAARQGTGYTITWAGGATVTRRTRRPKGSSHHTPSSDSVRRPRARVGTRTVNVTSSPGPRSGSPRARDTDRRVPGPRPAVGAGARGCRATPPRATGPRGR